MKPFILESLKLILLALHQLIVFVFVFIFIAVEDFDDFYLGGRGSIALVLHCSWLLFAIIVVEEDFMTSTLVGGGALRLCCVAAGFFSIIIVEDFDEFYLDGRESLALVLRFSWLLVQFNIIRSLGLE
jgi:hypothetical protein